MPFLRNHAKKIAALFITTIVISLASSFSSLRAADSSSGVLGQILTALTATLNLSDAPIPTYMYFLNQNDSFPRSAYFQGDLGNYSVANVVSNYEQLGLQSTLMNNFFGSSTSIDPSMSYITLLNTPIPTDGGPPTNYINYIQNASSLTMTHVPPASNWRGSTSAQQKYSNFYAVSSAVQTFDGYVLSQIYGDQKAGIPALQTQLMIDASAAAVDKNGITWATQVAGESIGAVLRQLLLYQSQMFILLFQQLQTQKLILQTQIMTNSLLVLNNQSNESMLLNNAEYASATTGSQN